MKLQVVKNRKIWFTFSGLLVTISIVSLLVVGLKFGIDFTGGTLLEMKTGTTDVQAVKDTLKEFPEISSIKVQSSGEDSYIMRFGYIGNDTHTKFNDFLKEKYPNFVEERYETVGPVIGEDLKKKAIISLTLAIIFIIMFVAFAFRKIPESMSSWKFGIVAVVALIHDVLITVGVFSLLGYFINVEVDSLFVTALLTVMGWSVNDTIVIFDRIRENIIKNRRNSFAQSASISVNETLVRSINTSLTTLITLSALFFFAGASIKFFVLALIVGVIVGTYSSIFLAAPLLVIWQEKVSASYEDNDAMKDNEDDKEEKTEETKEEQESKKRKKASKKKRRR